METPKKFSRCSVCNKKVKEYTYHKHLDDLFCKECVESEVQHINNLLTGVPDGETWNVSLTIFSIKGKETEYHVRYGCDGNLERMPIKKNQVMEILNISRRSTKPDEGLSILDTEARVVLTHEQDIFLQIAEAKNK